MSPPLAKNMSSISGAKSGSSIWLDCCIAREVRPILRPLMRAAVGQLQRHPGALDGIAVVDGHARVPLREVAQLRARLARVVAARAPARAMVCGSRVVLMFLREQRMQVAELGVEDLVAFVDLQRHAHRPRGQQRRQFFAHDGRQRLADGLVHSGAAAACHAHVEVA